MGKKVEKEKNEIVEEFFRRNDPKNIKSMNDMYSAWKEFFAPAFQKLLDFSFSPLKKKFFREHFYLLCSNLKNKFSQLP